MNHITVAVTGVVIAMLTSISYAESDRLYSSLAVHRSFDFA
jgi:hypothetical protein